MGAATATIGVLRLTLMLAALGSCASVAVTSVQPIITIGTSVLASGAYSVVRGSVVVYLPSPFLYDNLMGWLVAVR